MISPRPSLVVILSEAVLCELNHTVQIVLVDPFDRNCIEILESLTFLTALYYFALTRKAPNMGQWKTVEASQ